MPAGGMLKSISSGVGVAFASNMAWRRDPGPESAVVVTTKVAAWSGNVATPNANAKRNRFIGVQMILLEHQRRQSQLGLEASSAGKRSEMLGLAGKNQLKNGITITITIKIETGDEGISNLKKGVD